MKRILSVLLSVCMLVAVLPLFPQQSSAEGLRLITREMWISALVDTFSMSVEEDASLPDDYFPDVTSDSEYYEDILFAIEFGVIDLAAGENFEPQGLLDREFAAQTLNRCLNYQLEEDAEYTFSDADEATCPDDIQALINAGFFELEDGKFGTNTAVNNVEMDRLLAKAKEVLERDEISETYESSFQFADGVVVIPEGTEVSIDEDYIVTVTGYDTNIEKDDIFVVFSNKIPVALKALDVIANEGSTTIISTPEGAENAVIEVDSQGVAEIDLESFKAEDTVTYSVTDTETDDVQLMSIGLQGIEYDKKTKTLTATHDVKLSDVCAGSISVEVSDLKLYHKESTGKGEYEAYITANTVVTKTISFDFGSYAGLPNKILLGYVPLEGIGDIRLEVEVSLKGGMSETQEGTIMAGFGYARGDGFRLIKGYKETSYSFTAEAEVKIGLTYSINIDLVVVSGRIWATVGVKGTYHFKDFTYVDQNRPLQCETIKAHLYANVGVSVYINYVIDQQSWSKTHDIYNEDNSPCRVYYHYEDGELVDTCTRGKTDNDAYTKYTTKTTSRYFNPSPSYSKGSYSNSDGTTTTIWTYTLDSSNNATITGYKGSATAIAIPSKVDGYTVTKIGNNAFANNVGLKSVTMANTITEIGNSAFYGCSSLENVKLPKYLTTLWQNVFTGTKIKSVTIPKTLNQVLNPYGPFNNAEYLTDITIEEGTTEVQGRLFSNIPNVTKITVPDTVAVIGACAFSNCKSLNTVELPDSVVEIKNEAFINCTSLENVKLPKYLTTLWQNVFTGTKIKSVTIPKTLNQVLNPYGPFNNAEYLTDITIEEGTTEVQGRLFSNIPNVTKITVPDTVTVIGACAFSNCKSLNTVELPDSVVEIKNEAFINCTSLENVKLPKYLTTLWQNVFTGTKIKSVTIPKTLNQVLNPYGPFNNAEYLTDITIEEGTTEVQGRLFSNIPNVTKITVPDTVAVIGACAFSNCKSLNTVELPDSVVEIQREAFINCSSLENVNIPKYLTTLSSNLFDSCIAFKVFNIPDNIIKMEANVFSNCTELKEVRLSNSCNTIPASAFYNCIALENIILPENLETIGGSAFYGCKALVEIELPETLKTIDGSAFYECKTLSEIIIPENVSSIGASAFNNCDALTKAVIKGSGTIGEKAFYDCDALTSIIIGDKVTSIGKNLCYSCDNLTEINLGKGITTIPDSAFRLCQNLETVTIPRFCTTIAANAFAENTKLASAYIPESVTSIQSNSFSYPHIMTVYGKEGSYAQEYSVGRGFPFNAVDKAITTLAYPESSMRIAYHATVLPDMQIMPGFDTDTVTFTSGDANIATVSASGAVYGKNYGTTTITMETESGLSDSIEVTVVRPATSVTFNKNALELAAGNSEVLTATINPTNSTDELKWASSDTSVAIVDESGKVTAVGEGTANITATTVYGNKTATCLVTVVKSDVPVVNVTGIKLNADNREITIGKTYTLKADVLPSDATNKMVEWTSSNTSVADVVDGKITAKSLGTATITAKTVSGGFTATCTVTVVPKVEITTFTAANYGPYAFINMSAVNVPANAKVFIASYSNDGKLLEIQSPAMANGAASAIFQTASVEYYKALIWKTTASPSSDAKECTLN